MIPIKNGICIVKSTQNNILNHNCSHSLNTFEYITKRARNPKSDFKFSWKLVYRFLLEYGTQRYSKHIFGREPPKRDININIKYCIVNTLWPTLRLKRLKKSDYANFGEFNSTPATKSYIFVGNSFFFIYIC